MGARGHWGQRPWGLQCHGARGHLAYRPFGLQAIGPTVPRSMRRIGVVRRAVVRVRVCAIGFDPTSLPFRSSPLPSVFSRPFGLGHVCRAWLHAPFGSVSASPTACLADVYTPVGTPFDRLDKSFPMVHGTCARDVCAHVYTHVNTHVRTHVYTGACQFPAWLRARTRRALARHERWVRWPEVHCAVCRPLGSYGEPKSAAALLGCRKDSWQQCRSSEGRCASAHPFYTTTNQPVAALFG